MSGRIKSSKQMIIRDVLDGREDARNLFRAAGSSKGAVQQHWFNALHTFSYDELVRLKEAARKYGRAKRFIQLISASIETKAFYGRR